MMIGVLGAGSWGGALSISLANAGHRVFLWSNDSQEIDKLRRTRRLTHKLPDVVLPESVTPTTDPSDFTLESEMLVVAVPSKVIRDFASAFRPWLGGKVKIVVCATKGLESISLATMSAILEQEWLDELASGVLRGVAALSGPSHAEEVARALPTAIVAAHPNEAVAQAVQETFQTPRFRVYRNPDRLGVEIGAALKNVLAISVGVSDGLGFGDNARAALISRGLHEMSQAGALLGARPETFSGLSGLGDLVVTCTSRHSRNRRFGELIAKGYRPEEAEDEIGMVVEGVSTVLAVPSLVKRCEIELPISQEVYSVVIEGADPKQSVENLMLRESKPEG